MADLDDDDDAVVERVDALVMALVPQVKAVLLRNAYFSGKAAYLRRALVEAVHDLNMTDPPGGAMVDPDERLETVAQQLAGAAYMMLFAETLGPLVPAGTVIPPLAPVDDAALRAAYASLVAVPPAQTEQQILRAMGIRWMIREDGGPMFRSPTFETLHMNRIINSGAENLQREILDHVRAHVSAGGAFADVKWQHLEYVLMSSDAGFNFVGNALADYELGQTPFWHFIRGYNGMSVAPILDEMLDLDVEGVVVSAARAYDLMLENLVRHLLTGIFTKFRLAIMEYMGQYTRMPIRPAAGKNAGLAGRR
jgi:hypothetical protein